MSIELALAKDRRTFVIESDESLSGISKSKPPPCPNYRPEFDAIGIPELLVFRPLNVPESTWTRLLKLFLNIGNINLFHAVPESTPDGTAER
jgi:hypothetical protein